MPTTWCDHIRALPLLPAEESFLRKKIEAAIEAGVRYGAISVGDLPPKPTYESIIAEDSKS